MRQGSLKIRLLTAGAASIVAALVIAAVGLLILFERHVERNMAGQLEAHLRQLVSGLERATDGSLRLAREPAEPRFQEPLGGLYWQLRMPDGALLRSRSLWDAVLELPPDRLADGEVHEHSASGPGGASLLVVERAVALPATLGAGQVRAAVAVDRAEVHAAGRAFAADLAPALAILMAFLIAAAWLQVVVGLHPLEAVRERLSDVRAGHTARLGAAFPDEVRPLAAEVDSLLDAQVASLERARARAADLAHGLKTPLTVLAASADELRARGDSRLADDIASVTDNMRRHIERELARARAGFSARSGHVHPIRPVAERVIDVLRRTPRGQNLAWELHLAPDLALSVDIQDTTEILGNLAENAAKWAATKVHVSGKLEDSAVTLSIEDDGPGIPDDRVDAALARGGRLDQARPGAGLGLAIVSDLAEAYGGSLSLGRSPLGGLAATVRLPRGRESGPVRPASVP
jgi:signal transduction histidine kinase